MSATQICLDAVSVQLGAQAFQPLMSVLRDVAASSRLFSELAREFAGQLFVLAVDDGSVHQPLPLDSLQRAGVISYRRGCITLLNRPELEERSCECYAVVKDEFERLFPRALRVPFHSGDYCAIGNG
mgnify:CR=1 FL=1